MQCHNNAQFENNLSQCKYCFCSVKCIFFLLEDIPNNCVISVKIELSPSIFSL